MALLEAGTAVTVNGLKARPDLNGKTAKIVAYVPERERYHLTMDDGEQEELYLKPSNVELSGRDEPVADAQASEAPVETPAAPTEEPTAAAPPEPTVPALMDPGTVVEVSGLKARPDLNGKHGTVVAYAADRQRYHVNIIGTEEETYLRPANITIVTKPAPAPAPEPAPVPEEGAAERDAILREASNGAAAAASAPTPPIEELKDDETLLKEFFADVSDASRDAEVERILACFKLNPYEHLNVRFDAGEETIKRAFRKVSLLVHPDKCKHPSAKAAFDAIGQAQTLLGKEEVKRELDFNLTRAKESVIKAWRKETRNDVVLRVRYNGDRDAQLADFLESDEFQERWKLEGRKNIVDLEWRRRKLTLRIAAEEERVEKEEKEEAAERKKQSKAQKNWDEEKAREGRVGGWRDFTSKKKAKRQKVAGEFKAPTLKKETRAKEEEYHGLDKNGNRVLRPDEVTKAW